MRLLVLYDAFATTVALLATSIEPVPSAWVVCGGTVESVAFPSTSGCAR